MNISLRQIEVFLAAADSLSFSRAAQACHLSQPALSANIKRLEEELGARLFDRHTRKVALTPVGAEFLAVARALMDNTGAALSRVQDYVAGNRGRLILASAPSMAANFLPAVIAQYQREHPLIDVQLHDELSERSIEMVRSGIADIAFAPAKPGADDLLQQVLFRDPINLVCAAGHPLARLERVRWRDVQHYPQIVVSQRSSVRQLVDAEYALSGTRMRPAFEVAQVGTMLGLIGEGVGIGVLPKSLLDTANTSRLARRPIADGTTYRTICAITPASRTPAPAVQPFLQLCMLHAAERQLKSDAAAKRPPARRSAARPAG